MKSEESRELSCFEASELLDYFSTGGSREESCFEASEYYSVIMFPAWSKASEALSCPSVHIPRDASGFGFGFGCWSSYHNGRIVFCFTLCGAIHDDVSSWRVSCVCLYVKSFF